MTYRYDDTSLPKIVIIGGGFAGLELVKRLNNKPYRVTLLDKNNFHTFQPLLYQIASAGLTAESIAYPFRRKIGQYPNIIFRLATVEKIEYFAKGMDPYITYKYYIDKSLWLYETGLISLDSLLDEPNFRITRKGIGSTVKKDVTSILKEPQNSEPRSKQGETSWLLWISSDYVLQLITHLKNKNPWVSRSYVEMLIERLRNHEIDVTDLEQKMSQIQN